MKLFIKQKNLEKRAWQLYLILINKQKLFVYSEKPNSI